MRAGRFASWGLAAAVIFVSLGCESNREIVLKRENMKNHGYLAQLYYDQGRFNLSVDQAKRALAVDEDYVKALCILGYAELQLARLAKSPAVRRDLYGSSEENFLHAIRSGSESSAFVFKSYYGLGLLYLQWAREVERQINELEGPGAVEEEPPLTGEETGEEDLWTE
jgi:hypothetical protein